MMRTDFACFLTAATLAWVILTVVSYMTNFEWGSADRALITSSRSIRLQIKKGRAELKLSRKTLIPMTEKQIEFHEGAIVHYGSTTSERDFPLGIRWVTLRFGDADLLQLPPSFVTFESCRLSFSAWLIWVGIAPGWIAFLWSPLRRLTRLRRGHCFQCGYDLTGNVSGKCPECGTAM